MATLGEQAVGSIVKLNLKGTPTDFIVVQQGLPSSVYDSSCDGTWLLTKDCVTKRAWDSTDNDYANSDIHAYLKNTFINRFDNDIAEFIKQVKIPYTQGTGSGGTVKTGSSGLSVKAFLLSRAEIMNSGVSNANTEGAVLDYFDGSTEEDRIANYEGEAEYWWMRSPDNGRTNYVHYVHAMGTSNTGSCKVERGIRPVLIWSPELTVKSDGTITTTRQVFGYVNILGSNKEFTGAGFVKINGVLCQITSSMMKHNGVLKSLFIGTPAAPPSRLPEGYTEVEYIKLTGTQYVDTGYKANGNTRVVLDFELTDASANLGVFGGRTGNNSKTYTLFWVANTGYRSDYNTGQKSVSGVSGAGRHTVDKNKGVTTIDGVTASATSATFDSGYNMYLGTINTAGTAFASGLKGNIYSCQIYDNGTLVRDFVPCKNSSGAAGLYDLVNSKFYGNNGSGSITAGAEI